MSVNVVIVLTARTMPNSAMSASAEACQRLDNVCMFSGFSCRSNRSGPARTSQAWLVAAQKLLLPQGGREVTHLAPSSGKRSAACFRCAAYSAGPRGDRLQTHRLVQRGAFVADVVFLFQRVVRNIVLRRYPTVTSDGPSEGNQRPRAHHHARAHVACRLSLKRAKVALLTCAAGRSLWK